MLSRREWFIGAAALSAAPIGLPRIASAQISGGRDAAPLIAAIRDFAQAELDAYGFPGMTLAIAGPDGLSATLALGYADMQAHTPVGPDTLFQIGSISKSMCALALYALVAKRKLDLDAPVAAIIPGLSLPPETITVAQLLNHSGGLPADPPLFPRAFGDRLWTGFAPGSRFSYSNTGFQLLGEIVARVSGMSYGQALRTLVLRPLGLSGAEPLILTADRARYAQGHLPMDDRPFFPRAAMGTAPWIDFDNAAGSVAATAPDMARYLAYLVRLGRGDGAPLMPPALARRFVMTTIDAAEFGAKGRYASGIATVEVDGRPCLHHTGGMLAFSSSITVDPVAGGGVFASVNARGGGYRPRQLTQHGCRLIRAFAEGKPLPPAPAIVPVPPVEHADDFAGRYLAAGGDAIIVAADGKALSLNTKEGRGRVRPGSPGVFFTDHPRLYAHELAFPGKGRRDRLWWGGKLYGRGKALPTPRADPTIVALVGVYATTDPWSGSLSLVAREAALILEGAGELRRAPDGSWRPADPELACERILIDQIVDGRARRASFSGAELKLMPNA